jgi:hypothetical protein
VVGGVELRTDGRRWRRRAALAASDGQDDERRWRLPSGQGRARLGLVGVAAAAARRGRPVGAAAAAARREGWAAGRVGEAGGAATGAALAGGERAGSQGRPATAGRGALAAGSAETERLREERKREKREGTPPRK